MEKKKLEVVIENIEKAAESWPEIFPRRAVPNLTGGLYSAGYMANLDSKGEGPEGAFNIGRNKVYLRGKFVTWMVKRLEM